VTKPTDIETLKRFYTKVHPGGIGWKPIAKQLPEVKADTGYPALFVNWAAGCFLVLCMLFSIGQFLFGSGLLGCVFVLVALLSAGVIYFNISRTDFTQD
ncbi:MAG: sodium:solute symporter family protein, partial [Planctomycetota bacterium]